MKRLIIEKIEENLDVNDPLLVSIYMESQELHSIENQTWEEYKTDSEAKFSLAYNNNFLFLKYNVKEEEFNSIERCINGDVHKDNCVEFFVSFENSNYYNLEFNCLGNVKVGYGSERKDRKMLSKDIIKEIKIFPKLNSKDHLKLNRFCWELLLIIPKEFFIFSSIKTFENVSCKANFYKCGDDLLKPHFLTWNKIDTEFPDFHQPNFFGEILFK